MPPHWPPQQSSFVVHDAPVTAHADVHTDTPASPGWHEPLQHVSFAPHGASRGRHGPGPKPHRPDAMSQAPQHGGTVTDWLQSSPAARQSVAASRHRPSDDSHWPEQHSPSVVHGSPSMVQIAPPHVPPLHASEQQSEGTVHAVPSTRQ
jgi:hypothetical protein